MFSSGTSDYLTITAKIGTQEWASMQAVYDAIKYDDITQGLDERPARALGYVGDKIGTLFIGTSPQGGILRVSGALSEVACKMLAWLPGNHHVTRLDFQLTWELQDDDMGRAERIATEVRKAQAASTLKNAPKVRLLTSYGEGDTVNIGSRSSEVFIRIYDKSREQKVMGPPWLWRYEVELKGERALQAMRLYKASSGDNHTVYQIVDYWMRDRLVPVPWQATDALDWPQVGRPETDAERKLKWLENSVKSSVQYLIHKGHRQLVYEALGLDV